jgi:hypothetical protein
MYTSAKRDAVAHNDPFQLVAVERCEPPHDGASGAWCQYTIAQGDNVITCIRKGSRTMVNDAAREIVTVLNDRRADRRGRVHLVIKGKS